MSVSINGTSGLVFNDASTQNTSAFTGGFAMRNRIINGAMVIDQRNAGASVTPSTTVSGFAVDRFLGDCSVNSKYTVQQNAGSVTPPTGFSNYLGATSSSAYSILTGDYFYLTQVIEGFNTADLAWGTASAATVTLSFWVRSSLTGTFGGSIRNGAGNRSYPFSYTISSANTWEQKTITIAGDTSGTWVGATNGRGMYIFWGLGVGATYSGTAGSWAGANYFSATGATSVVGTNGATFYITGVQLEKGSTATSFDYRPYGTELQLAQRYFQSYSYADGSMITTGTSGAPSIGYLLINLCVPMRTAPSTITLPSVGGTSGTFTVLTTAGAYPSTYGTIVAGTANPTNFRLNVNGFTGLYTGGGVAMFLYSTGTTTITASAEL